MGWFTKDSGAHRDHLPRDKDNKQTDDGTSSKQELQRLARAQGEGTKEDAKAARQRSKWW